MKRVCQFCGAEDGTEDGDAHVTHVICPACWAKIDVEDDEEFIRRWNLLVAQSPLRKEGGEPLRALFRPPQRSRSRRYAARGRFDSRRHAPGSTQIGPAMEDVNPQNDETPGAEAPRVRGALPDGLTG